MKKKGLLIGNYYANEQKKHFSQPHFWSIVLLTVIKVTATPAKPIQSHAFQSLQSQIRLQW